MELRVPRRPPIVVTFVPRRLHRHHHPGWDQRLERSLRFGAAGGVELGRVDASEAAPLAFEVLAGQCDAEADDDVRVDGVAVVHGHDLGGIGVAESH
jgi:hypothetical protein